MQAPYGEGVADHTGPESCAGNRKAAGEALTGEDAGQVLSSEITSTTSSGMPILLTGGEGHMIDDDTQSPVDPAESENLVAAATDSAGRIGKRDRSVQVRLMREDGILPVRRGDPGGWIVRKHEPLSVQHEILGCRASGVLLWLSVSQTQAGEVVEQGSVGGARWTESLSAHSELPGDQLRSSGANAHDRSRAWRTGKPTWQACNPACLAAATEATTLGPSGESAGNQMPNFGRDAEKPPRNAIPG